MKTKIEKKRKLTPVSILHYIRLTYRSLLFLAALIIYIASRIEIAKMFPLVNRIPLIDRLSIRGGLPDTFERHPAILAVIWSVFTVEMILRFFPSKLESPGCQKQFARNYIKSGKTQIDIKDNHGTVLVALLWICFNGIFGALHMMNIFDDGMMILISCAFSVCDMICILFYCPFQSLFLKNKCCSTCRIYNWDYAMMFTPLFFVKRGYAWSLFAMSVVLLFRWEITFFRHPERFSEATNDYLRCENCSEKLCSHKRQLHGLWKHIAEITTKRIQFLKK